MCNRFASRQIAGRITAQVMDAIGAPDRDAILAKAQRASRIVDLLRKAELRKEARARQLGRVRRERREQGLLDEGRGTPEWHLYDQACWMVARLYDEARALTDPEPHAIAGDVIAPGDFRALIAGGVIAQLPATVEVYSPTDADAWVGIS